MPGNYRPVSNLCFLSKLLERVANEQLLDHLRSNNLIPEHQSAYRKSHSTETALLKVTSDALLAADRGMVTLLGLLDLSAAFDCVDHRIFLRRMEVSFGISATAIAWIGSYLEDREQCVRYNGSLSETVVLKYGVPQGSVLGPLYFILYTSDVFDLADLHGFHVHGYADDLQLYDHCLPCDTDILSNRFSNCVDDIREWMSRNRLRLNSSKTEVIWLGSRQRVKALESGRMMISGGRNPKG